jgi:hypothetical protein
MADEHLAQLITDVKESLEREIRQVERKIEVGFAQVNERLDAQAARLERQGSNWQTGRRWSARMDDWAEKIDAVLETKSRSIDQEIAELRARLDRLEGKAS